MAVTLTDLFLGINHASLLADASEVEAQALGVANDSITAAQNESFVRSRIIRLHWSEDQIQQRIARLPTGTMEQRMDRLLDFTISLMKSVSDEDITEAISDKTAAEALIEEKRDILSSLHLH